jgi:16S rRNA (cytosine1402-N4)-methyltransferase
MTAEVVDALRVEPGGVYVDCSVGEGGHAEAVVRATHAVSLLGIDLDRDALKAAERRLSFSSGVELVHGNSAEVERIASEHRATPVNGVLFDLGVSSLQLDTPERGFSFRHEAPLDMRFSSDGDTTADDIVNRYPERELEAIIRQFGEEPRSRAVARAIVRRRRIETTTRLAAVVSGALNRPGRGRIHPATRTFQALRIAVNGELDNLTAGLEGAIQALRQGGRLVVISYHSLEDRLVKDLLRREASECICPPSTPVCICGHVPSIRLINRRVITPSAEEVRSNPRARSAKMRIAERL